MSVAAHHFLVYKGTCDWCAFGVFHDASQCAGTILGMSSWREKNREKRDDGQ